MDNGENDMSKASDVLTNVFYYMDKSTGKTQKIIVDKRNVRDVKFNGKTCFLRKTNSGVVTFMFTAMQAKTLNGGICHQEFSFFASEDSPLMEIFKISVLPKIGTLNEVRQSEDGLSLEIKTPFLYPDNSRIVATLFRVEIDIYTQNHTLVIGNERRAVSMASLPHDFFDLVSLVLRDCDCQKGLGDK